VKKSALLLAVALVLLPATSSRALMSEPTPTADPVPDAWRQPLERFLQSLGVNDVEVTVAKSKATEFRSSVYDTKPARMIFRIVHHDGCTPDEDACMTIVGHSDHSELKADVILLAGDRMTVGDHAVHVLGADPAARPIIFVGKKLTVGVVETAKGLLVVPQESGPAR
jgi:hypothetical protein